MLVELALLDGFRPNTSGGWLKGTRVVATVNGRLPAPLLQSAYDAIATRPRHVQALLITIEAGPRKPLIERLLQHGLIGREQRRFLGPSCGRAVPGPRPLPRGRVRAFCAVGRFPLTSPIGGVVGWAQLPDVVAGWAAAPGTGASPFWTRPSLSGALRTSRWSRSPHCL